MRLRIPITFLALTLAVLPWSAGATISSTSFQIDPDSNVFSSSIEETASASFRLEANVEPINGRTTATSFVAEIGGASRYYCGDGFIDPGETCDGNNFGGATCITQGFVSGSLSCSAACAIVTSGCNVGGGGGGGGGGGTPPAAVPSSPSVSTQVNAGATFTYQSTLLLFGTKTTDTENVFVNQSTTGVTYPTSTSWQKTVSLVYGKNTFSIYASNSTGNSSTILYEIYRRLVGDMTGDNVVNDYDLSKMVRLWGTSDPSGDFNGDGIVNDYDFSMFVARWSTSV